MGTSDKFCLRWNDFENNISGAFRELREDKDFFDVTLACDDEQMQAHKVILSACSPFFRGILRRNKHDHPLLYLKGVKHADLVSVLNFMYHGEVNVAQEELNSFLAVAEDLKVKGLTQNNSETKHQPSAQTHKSVEHGTPRARSETDQTIQPLKRQHPTPASMPRPPTTGYHQEDDDIQEVAPIKMEPASIPQETQQISSHAAPSRESYITQGGHDISNTGVVADPNTEYGDEYGDYGGYDGGYEGEGLDNSGYSQVDQDGNKGCTDSLISSNYSKTSCPETGVTIWQCLKCTKTSKWKTSIKNHVESSHLNNMLQFHCSYCPHINNTSAGLKMHTKRNHQLI